MINANDDGHFSCQACIWYARQNTWCPMTVRVCLHAETVNSMIFSGGPYDVGLC
jgi:hypothetical protein